MHDWLGKFGLDKQIAHDMNTLHIFEVTYL